MCKRLRFFKNIFFCLLSFASCKAGVDVIVFSYNRPMQLYAFIESFNKYVRGDYAIHVLYLVDNEQFNYGYSLVSEAFKRVNFVRQKNNAFYFDFKAQLLRIFFNGHHDYTIFAVDDIMVTDYIDLSRCIAVLEQTNSYAFLLRLGLNIHKSFPDILQNVPSDVRIDDDILQWQFDNGSVDWRYPNNLDLTLYRKKDIEYPLVHLAYANPNQLEGQWQSNFNDLSKLGLCFEHSKMVNIPLNQVQKVCQVPHMNAYTPEQLLAYFLEGKKIDIEPLFKIHNESPHMAYYPLFVSR